MAAEEGDLRPRGGGVRAANAEANRFDSFFFWFLSLSFIFHDANATIRSFHQPSLSWRCVQGRSSSQVRPFDFDRPRLSPSHSRARR